MVDQSLQRRATSTAMTASSLGAQVIALTALILATCELPVTMLASVLRRP